MRVLTKVLPKAVALLIVMAMALAPLAVTNVRAEGYVQALQATLHNVDAGIQVNTSTLTTGGDYTISFWFQNAPDRIEVMVQWVDVWTEIEIPASAAGEWVRHDVPFTATGNNIQIVPNNRAAGDIWRIAEVTITPDGGAARVIPLNVATGVFGHWGQNVIETIIVDVPASYFGGGNGNGNGGDADYLAWFEWSAWVAYEVWRTGAPPAGQRAYLAYLHPDFDWVVPYVAWRDFLAWVEAEVYVRGMLPAGVTLADVPGSWINLPEVIAWMDWVAWVAYTLDTTYALPAGTDPTTLPQWIQDWYAGVPAPITFTFIGTLYDTRFERLSISTGPGADRYLNFLLVDVPNATRIDIVGYRVFEGAEIPSGVFQRAFSGAPGPVIVTVAP